MKDIPQDLTDVEVVALDYDMKIKLLERIAQEMLNSQKEFISVSGRYAEIKASMSVLRQVKSAVQSALKAEKSLSTMNTTPRSDEFGFTK